MKLYAFYFAKYGKTKSQKELANLVGIAPETISRWKNIKDYQEWFDREVAEQRQPIHDRLEYAALNHLEDPRFWKLLAEKHGYLKPKKNG